MKKQVTNFSLALAASLALLSGCIAVREQGSSSSAQEPDTRSVELSEKPAVPMSDELVRSDAGDMIALLPKGWFLVEPPANAPAGLIAVAVNPDYTLSLAFSSVRIEGLTDEEFEREGVLALVRRSVKRRQDRTGGAFRLTGTYDVMSMGTRRYGIYRGTTDNGLTNTSVAVFRSSLGAVYEVTLTPLLFLGRQLEQQQAVESIFTSVLATVDY